MSKNYRFAQFYKNYDPKTVVFFANYWPKPNVVLEVKTIRALDDWLPLLASSHWILLCCCFALSVCSDICLVW